MKGGGYSHEIRGLVLTAKKPQKLRFRLKPSLRHNIVAATRLYDSRIFKVLANRRDVPYQVSPPQAFLAERLAQERRPRSE